MQKINKILLLALSLVSVNVYSQGLKFGWDHPEYQTLTNYNVYLNNTNILSSSTNSILIPYSLFLVGKTNEVFVTAKRLELESKPSNTLKFVLDENYKITHPKPKTPANLRKN